MDDFKGIHKVQRCNYNQNISKDSSWAELTRYIYIEDAIEHLSDLFSFNLDGVRIWVNNDDLFFYRVISTTTKTYTHKF